MNTIPRQRTTDPPIETLVFSPLMLGPASELCDRPTRTSVGSGCQGSAGQRVAIERTVTGEAETEVVA